jgi:hypothetical protein
MVPSCLFSMPRRRIASTIAAFASLEMTALDHWRWADGNYAPA